MGYTLWQSLTNIATEHGPLICSEFPIMNGEFSNVKNYQRIPSKYAQLIPKSCWPLRYRTFRGFPNLNPLYWDRVTCSSNLQSAKNFLIRDLAKHLQWLVSARMGSLEIDGLWMNDLRNSYIERPLRVPRMDLPWTIRIYPYSSNVYMSGN